VPRGVPAAVTCEGLLPAGVRSPVFGRQETPFSGCFFFETSVLGLRPSHVLLAFDKMGNLSASSLTPPPIPLSVHPEKGDFRLPLLFVNLGRTPTTWPSPPSLPVNEALLGV